MRPSRVRRSLPRPDHQLPAPGRQLRQFDKPSRIPENPRRGGGARDKRRPVKPGREEYGKGARLRKPASVERDPVEEPQEPEGDGLDYSIDGLPRNEKGDVVFTRALLESIHAQHL